jgi:hypothetical protein
MRSGLWATPASGFPHPQPWGSITQGTPQAGGPIQLSLSLPVCEMGIFTLYPRVLHLQIQPTKTTLGEKSPGSFQKQEIKLAAHRASQGVCVNEVARGHGVG